MGWSENLVEKQRVLFAAARALDAVDVLYHVVAPDLLENVLEAKQITYKRPGAHRRVDLEQIDRHFLFVQVDARHIHVGAQCCSEKGQGVVTLAPQIARALQRSLDVFAVVVGPPCHQIVPCFSGDRRAALLAHRAAQVLFEPFEPRVTLVPGNALLLHIRVVGARDAPASLPTPQAKRDAVPTRVVECTRMRYKAWWVAYPFFSSLQMFKRNNGDRDPQQKE